MKFKLAVALMLSILFAPSVIAQCTSVCNGDTCVGTCIDGPGGFIPYSPVAGTVCNGDTCTRTFVDGPGGFLPGDTNTDTGIGIRIDGPGGFLPGNFVSTNPVFASTGLAYVFSTANGWPGIEMQHFNIPDVPPVDLSRIKNNSFFD
jgi:hypothetical protein